MGGTLKDWAYTIVDSVLHIGAYKGIFLGHGATTLRLAALAKEREEYPVFTLRQGIIMPLAEPIFLKPFTEEQVFDIVFNRIEVHLLLSIEGLRKLFIEVGAETHWMSRRASALARQSDPYNSFLVHNDRCLLVKSGSTQIIVGDGLLGRIIFDSMRPKAVVVMFAHEESM